jgi:dolichol-phosphate mannosyltransferase
LLSVVVPVFNEEDALPLFFRRLRPVLDGTGGDYEVLVVDDGSTDSTPQLLEEARKAWGRLRVVRLRRNYGQQAAFAAGLERCGGDLVVTLDADLQDPPELIPSLIAAASATEADVVYAVRADRRSDSFFKRRSAGLYYRAMQRIIGGDLPRHAGDYRLVSRAVVDTLNGLPERRRVYRLLIPWLGFPSTTVAYSRGPRAAGASKYPTARMARLAVDSVTSFTGAPLRLATWAGVAGSVVCLAAAAVAVVAKLAGATVPGWASLFVALFFLGAIQLLCLGLLGEYIGRLYVEAQHRPLYFVAQDSECVDRTPMSREPDQ